MRFNIGGTKFGHVPLTGLSPTELRQSQARQSGGVQPHAAQGPAAGEHPPAAPGPLHQRAPARPAAFQPPDAAGAPSQESRLTKAFIRLPSPSLALERQAFAAAPLGRPDPAGRVFQASDFYSHSQSQSHESIAQGGQRTANVPIEVAAARVGAREKPGNLADIRPEVPQLPLAQQRLRQQLSPSVLAQYDDLKLQVTHATIPAYTDADVTRPAKKLGAGSLNTVFSVRLRDASGAQVEGVFKPLMTTERGWVARATGIPRDNPQIAMRNIATAAYAQKLGFNVIADTKVALIKTPATNQAPGGRRVGLLMESAAGKIALHADASVMSKPDVVREVTKLQLLDHLTAQGDRHSSNYFVHVDAKGGVKVTGIDNDQCFGKWVTSPEGVRRGNDLDRAGFRGTRLPPVVDHEMAIAINSLTTKDLQAMLGDKLSPSEVSAAKQRLEGVQKHIANLESQGLIIDPSEWGHPNIEPRLRPGNNYAKREVFDAQRYGASQAAPANW